MKLLFKKGRAAHTNNFGLGDTSRYRTNVWDYAGVNTFGDTRDYDLAMHPTVKPIAMIADAIRDCSKRGDIVLDTFGGSGSTLIAADQCGRKANLIELDPHYCDTIIRRYQRITGEVAVLERTGKTFAQVVANAGVETCALVSTGTTRKPTSLTHGKCGVIRGHLREANILILLRKHWLGIFLLQTGLWCLVARMREDWAKYVEGFIGRALQRLKNQMITVA